MNSEKGQSVYHVSGTSGIFSCVVQFNPYYHFMGLPSTRLPVQVDRRLRFSLWVGKIPWRRAQQQLQYLAWRISWTEEPGRLQSMVNISIFPFQRREN